MNSIFLYIFLSVLTVSLISFIGIFFLSIKTKKLNTLLIYLISFSAGALLGDVFIHLLPESIEERGFNLITSSSILLGIIVFFVLEKIVHWNHCHMPLSKEHVHSFAYTNLFGDALHNFIDGIIIATSYLVSIEVGIATTIAVILHEIPQEIGDFGVLLHAGLSKSKALLLNFFTALSAVIGAILTLWFSTSIESFVLYLVPFAAGGFLYIAGSDLIPELHKHSDSLKRSLLQLLTLIAGILVMFLLIYLE